MAIYHLTAKVISRGNGQSAVAAAAYRSGERLIDEQTGEPKEYKARAERIQFEGVFAPQDAPDWAHDRQQLWNHVEQFNTAKNARLAREIEIALPHELSDEQREWLVKDFVREQFTRKGFIVDAAIHAPDKNSDARNYHAHLMVTTRRLEGDEFEQIADREQNTHATLKNWRGQWEHLANRHLERHGHEARIDHRSLEEQGIDREPGIHLGYAAAQMTERGAQSDRYDALREIMERNDAIRLEGVTPAPESLATDSASLDAPSGFALEQSPAPEAFIDPTSGQPFENDQAAEPFAAAPAAGAGDAPDLAPRRDALDGIADGGLAIIGKLADSLGSLLEGPVEASYPAAAGENRATAGGRRRRQQRPHGGSAAGEGDAGREQAAGGRQGRQGEGMGRLDDATRRRTGWP